jgi:hypothetical protein
MKLHDRYDWVVVGDGAWALLSGWLASRLGLRVLFVPFDGPHSFGQAPNGQFYWRDSSVFPVYEILKDLLKLEPKDEVLWKPISISVAHRFGVYDYSTFTDARSRENAKMRIGGEWSSMAFQSDTSAWTNWISSLNSHPTTQQDSSSKLRSKLDFKRLDPFANASLQRDYPQAVIAALLEAEGGVWNSQSKVGTPGFGEFRRFTGGQSAFKRWILSRSSALGAHVGGVKTLTRVFCNSGKLTSIQLDGHATPIACDGMVFGVPYASVKPLIHLTGQSILGGLAEVPPVTHDSWSRFYTLSGQRCLEDLPQLLLIAQGGGSPVIRVEKVSEDSLGLFGSDRLAVKASVRISRASPWLKEMDGEIIRSRIETEIEYWLPGFSQTQLRDWGPPVAGADDWSHFSEHSALGSFLGVEGLFLADVQSYPIFGSLGGFRAAIEATTWLAHLKGLRGLGE